MATTLVAAVVTAATLGVTHALEPDHVAGISSLTSRYGDPRLSALVGACFSLGHVALVVAWLVVGYLLLGRTEFAPVLDALGTVGVGVVLGVLGAVMAVGGLRTVLHAHSHEHAHGGAVHEHAHVHVGASDHDHRDEAGSASDTGIAGVIPHAHGHGVGAYLRTGVVGALFALSPPLSMIAFAAALFPDYGGGAVALAVGVYAVAITAAMSLLGAGVGGLFGTVVESPRAAGALRAVAGIAVVGFAGALLAGAVPALV
ncbi:MAG: hypothetical protein ABEJ89_10595 [Haloarculaceae archaeon]